MTIESESKFAIFDRGAARQMQSAAKERKDRKAEISVLHFLCVLCVLSRQFCPSGSVSSGLRMGWERFLSRAVVARVSTQFPTQFGSLQLRSTQINSLPTGLNRA